VLVLQGGGALGAYQAGAVQGLLDHGISFDWVVGTSIGAINGAIIAGNPPERRLARLKAFWDRVVHDHIPLFPTDAFPWMQPFASMSRVLTPLVNGVPGFFAPRPGSLFNLNGLMPTHEVGFYDTSSLEHTLNELVDFDYLDEAHVRYCACAVHIPTGELAIFDNREMRLTPRHVMASGALPPGFPPVVIDGEAYWDGGYAGNPTITPLVRECRSRDTILVQVNPVERPGTPRSARDIVNRLNEVSFNATLMKELRMMAVLRQVADPGSSEGARWAKMRIHRIASSAMGELGYSSKLNAEWEFLCMLRNEGRRSAEAFLAAHGADLGTRSTFDLDPFIEHV